MKPKLLLRVAAIVMLLHAVGHTIGHSSWKKATDPEKAEVIKQMTGHAFPFMGASRSMGDFYDGYGYSAAIALLLVTFLLWIIGGIAGNNAAVASKILLPVFFFLLLLGIDELIFFFPFAASFSLLAALLTLIAIVSLNKTKQA